MADLISRVPKTAPRYFCNYNDKFFLNFLTPACFIFSAKSKTGNQLKFQWHITLAHRACTHHHHVALLRVTRLHSIRAVAS